MSEVCFYKLIYLKRDERNDKPKNNIFVIITSKKTRIWQ